MFFLRAPKGGATALFPATNDNHFDVVEYLVTEAKADPSHPNKVWRRGVAHGSVACDVSPRPRCTRFQSLCLCVRAAVKPQPHVQNMSRSHATICVSDPELLYHCVVVPDVQRGLTPVHVAAHHGHIKLMEYFLEKCKTDPNLKDEVLRQ